MTPISPDGDAPARWLDTSALSDPTRCPACAAPLLGRRCAACRLDVSGPRGRELWELSREAATVLGRRSEVIAQMRLAAGPAQASPVRPATVRPAARPSALGRPVTAQLVTAQLVAARPVAARPVAARPVTARPVTSQPVPARSGWALQTILQVLGAVLLSGAGLVFTVFTWGQLSMPVRGAILVAITAAVFAGAHRAARAGLKTAAEVVAGLGSFLVVLDAWVLWTAVVGGPGTRAGIGTAWAVALVVGALVLVPLGRALSLLTVSVTGLVCLTTAPAVLALTISSAPGAAYLLAVSAALCLYAPRLFGPQVVVAGVPALARARTVLASLAPFYVAAAMLAVLGTLADVGAAQSAGPLLVLAAVCGAWAASAVAGARHWSAAAGCAVVLAGTAGAAAVTGTATNALAWTLPLGAVVGCAATVGSQRALPRLGPAAVRAGWVTVLLVGTLPVIALATLTLVALAEPAVLREAGSSVSVLRVLAGIGVVVVARPLLHLLGAQQMIVRAPVTDSGLAGPVLLPVPSRPYPPLPDRSGPQQPGPQQPGQQQPGPPLGVPVPRRPSILVDHPLGAGVVTAALLLLGLALLMPGAHWAAAVLLTVAALTALARTVLTGWVARASMALVPVTAFADRAASLMRVCVCLVCAVALTQAAVLGFALAAGADSVVSRTTGQALVAATFVVTGLVLWVAREWLPAGDARRLANRAALTGAAVVIASVGVGIVARLVVPLDAVGWYAAPLPLVLALVVIGARDLSAHQGVAPRPSLSADRLAALGSAALLCAPGFLVTALLALAGSGATGDAPAPQPFAVALLATVLLMTTGVLVWQLGFARATWPHRRLRATAGALFPLTAVLTLLSLRPMTAAADVGLARVDWLLAVLGLLGILVTWVGASTSGAARRGCEAGVVVLAGVVTTTIAVTVQADPARVTVALVINAVGALAYAVVARRPRWAWVALCLGVVASWVSLDGSGLPVELYTAPGAAVMLVAGIWQLVAALRSPGSSGSGPDPASGTASASASVSVLHAVRLVLGGLTVLLVPSVLLTPGAGTDGRALVVAVAVQWLGVTAWLLTRTAVAARLRPLVTGMAVLALAGAVVGLGGHAVGLAVQVAASTGTSVPPAGSGPATVLMTGLWTAVAVAVTAGLAALLTQARFQPSPAAGAPTSTHVGDPRVWAVTVCTALATVPVVVLVVGGWFGSASTRVCAVLVIVWGVGALLGTPPGFPRVRTSEVFVRRAVPALVGAYVMALVGAAAARAWSSAASVTPGTDGGEGDSTLVGLLILAGVFVAIVTVRAAQQDPTSSTWTTAGLGAVATLLPLTAEMILDPSGGWIAAAMVTAAAWLVLGVRLRWQAPVACGIVALLVQVVVLAGPPTLAALSGMLGWMVLAAVGGTLLALGLTYERQIAAARKVLLRYSELR